jgi:CBS domain-containing protein
MHVVESVLLDKGSDVIGVRHDTTVRQAAEKMIDANVGCLVVEDDEKVVGFSQSAIFFVA